MPTAPLPPIATLGSDIGRNSFHLIGLDARGAIVLRQKLSRGQVELRLATMPACLIGMEACVGAHRLSRQLLALGHDVKLIPAQFVTPFRKSHKNDFRDAEAIAEAVQRPTMRFVPTKSVEQLDLQALHRVRSRLVSQRTSVINQIRAFLLERGIAVRQRLRSLRQALPDILAQRTDVLMLRMVQQSGCDGLRLKVLARIRRRLELAEVCERKTRWRTVAPSRWCSGDPDGRKGRSANENQCARISMMARGAAPQWSDT